MQRLWIMMLIVLTGCGVGGDVTVTEGEDYSLPDWVEVDSFSGYGSSSPGGRISQKNWHVGWNELEPEEGIYNWGLVEKAFAEAKAGGYQINMHVTSVTMGGSKPEENIVVHNVVPYWVIEKYNPRRTKLGGLFNIEVIEAWKPDIQRAFNNMILAFGKEEFPLREELGAVYIHAISEARGEEFYLRQETTEMLERELGFSREAVGNWLKKRMDAYTDAFRLVEFKLAWIGMSQRFNWNPYRGWAEDLQRHAWARGIGGRGGGIEWYNNYLNNLGFAQRLTAEGYLLTDETNPNIATRRFFGEENEEYGKGWEWRWGPVEMHPYRYRMAMMRALQIRFRFLWTSDESEKMNPPLSEYARLSFGKTIVNTPDAWAYLREAVVPEPPGVTKNFERWLLQRDKPGGMTQPAERIDRQYRPGGSPDHMYDYAARRTDMASGNSAIYFDLDDRFRLAGPVDIKVEVLDNANAAWHLEYNTREIPAVATPTVTNQNDGKTRTVTFTLENAKFSNALEHDMDFRIVCDGPEDVTVRWVRVVRHNLPE